MEKRHRKTILIKLENSNNVFKKDTEEYIIQIMRDLVQKEFPKETIELYDSICSYYSYIPDTTPIYIIMNICIHGYLSKKQKRGHITFKIKKIKSRKTSIKIRSSLKIN